MNYINKNILLLSFSIILSVGFSKNYEDLSIDFLMNDSTTTIKKKQPLGKKNSKQSYSSLTKNLNKVEGLFTLYSDKENNKAYISILPEQLDSIYLAGLTRQSGDGFYLDGSSMLNEYLFMFKKIGSRIQFISINSKFRADKNLPILKSIKKHTSNSIISSAEIISAPNKTNGAILIELNKLLIFDIDEVNRKSQGIYTFDKKDSYFKSLKSFPTNTEIEIALHFKGKKGKYIYTLPNSRSVMIHYNLSLSEIQKSNYKPRLADDRVGHFTTIFQDYTDPKKDSPYIRYINRWNLEKKHPQNEISEPKKPIVYWLENSIPHEFREAVREGILAWNKAFEAAGFKNALEVKQMPDNAEWDPADVRYHTIRWMFQPGRSYAVGPSRANPYTGELYDADIRISADFVRSFYKEQTEFVVPVMGPTSLNFDETNNIENHDINMCKYGEHLREEMASAWDMMTITKIIDDSDTNLENYIYSGIKDLILHEVGHTLGLRHNFKGSSIYSIEQLSDPIFTEKYGISGSVMDYQPINIFDGKTFFQTKPGVYDFWAIEYAYSQPDRSEHSEKKFLENIASKSTDPSLRYGTDEDTYGTSTRGIDPHSNAWDLTNDPIAYYKKRFEMSKELLIKIPNYFMKKGGNYSKIRQIFGRSLRDYYSASKNIAKYIGGTYHSRHHIDDEKNKNPFQTVTAKKQKEALNFILTNILSIDAFAFDPNLLNKLAPERSSNFTGSVWSMNRIDYPIHDKIRSIQSGAVYRLHHPRIFARIQDNELKFLENESIYLLSEHFQTITEFLWSELKLNDDINSFRRDLQKSHVEVLTIILLNEKKYFTSDAIALARYNLKEIHQKIKTSLNVGYFNDYSQAHLSECANKIQSAYKAQTTIN